MTPEGMQAEQILDWAWDDPDLRAAEAHDRLAKLAEGATDQALIEIQDAGTMLARLSGPTMRVNTITSQAAQ